ncbi:MAG TPA: hypothetical protein EYN73_05160 [Chromatiaceae bacterium]|jgi:hypothetical protein|nr:hypothetical protein [Chromatiaceae bacterium]HIA08454.1 hypothetical protein [Chromatiaceae bacterium]
MATISRVPRSSGAVYKARVPMRGGKQISKTFRLKSDASAWAKRMEADLDLAKAQGNIASRTITISDQSCQLYHVDQYYPV